MADADRYECIAREDIRDNLPRGAITEIAKALGCNKGYIVNILKGKRAVYSERSIKIVEMAERLASTNLWNKKISISKFKLKPNINE